MIQALRSDDYTEAAYKALSSEELAAVRENDLGIISIPYIGLGVLVLAIMAIIVIQKNAKNCC